MYVLGLSNSDILKSEEMNFDLLSQGFHSQGVTGVDVCVRKPLVATCSTDKSVRIWQGLTRILTLRYPVGITRVVKGQNETREHPVTCVGVSQHYPSMP